MLTKERLDTLQAVGLGAVSARPINAPGTPYQIEPREYQVAAGFLLKAQLIQRDGKAVELTERGEHVLSRSRVSA